MIVMIEDVDTIDILQNGLMKLFTLSYNILSHIDTTFSPLIFIAFVNISFRNWLLLFPTNLFLKILNFLINLIYLIHLNGAQFRYRICTFL